MKRKYTILSAILAGCFLLTAMLLCACTGGQSGSEETTDGSVESTPEVPSDTSVATEVPTEPSSDTGDVTEATMPEETTAPETEPETYEVRLYSLMPESGSLMQSFVLRTKHGKLIVIDGGIDGDGFEKKAYMPAALRAIAGVGQDGYVEVEAWFLSHAHKDHFNELRKTLDEYTDDENFVIKNFYFDFPDYETPEYPSANSDSPYLELLKASLNHYAEVRGIPVTEGSTYYEDINGAVINAESIANGYEMNIDGVRIEFLHTWDASNGGVINDNSLVMRMWVEGQSILFLQDAAVAEGNSLIQKYGDALKSDIVQMAHHAQGGVSKLCYDRIDASVRIWPTPLWVWNNVATYAIEDTRQWVNGGVDFTTDSEYDIVTCLYDKYPSNRRVVANWERVIDGMYIPLPYAAVNTAPSEEETKEETPAVPDEPPIEHEYVSDGLVSMYLGGEGSTWIDVIGPHNVNLTTNDGNYLAAEGLYMDSVRQFFPQAIVDLINGEEFTVEMAMKDFVPLGTTYNTFMNSSDDAFALFRQCDGTNDFLMMKWAGKPAAFRPKTPNGMLELLSEQSTLSLTFKVGGAVTIYINGECVATYDGVDSPMLAGDLYIGHDQGSRNYKTLFTSVRFYDRALTAEEIAANAAVDALN